MIKKSGETYLIKNLKNSGTLMSAPVFISAQPLSIPKTHANSMISIIANITKEMVPAQ